MLKIKDDVDLKELEKFHIYPRYKCYEFTGEIYVDGIYQHLYYGHLKFKKKKISFAKRIIYGYKNKYMYVLKESDYQDLDVIYDLIKAGLVEKVEE